MKVRVSDRIAEVQEYYFSKKLRELAQLRNQGVDILNLGVGSPDQLPSNRVISKLQEAAAQDDHHGYQSYTGIPELKQAAADWYKRFFNVTIEPSTELLPLIGSKEGIMHISMTYLQPGDQVLIPDPGYPTYAAAARLAGGEVVKYPLYAEDDWFPRLQDLQAIDLSRVQMMWINYPNMPTGATATLNQLSELVSFCREHNILLCCDNPYAFILNETPTSIFQVPHAKEVALELHSLSKSYNMAGWRIGFLTGHQDRIREVLKFKSNMDSGMFKPIQLAAIEALSLPDDWFSQVNKIYRTRRAVVEQILIKLRCQFDPSQVGMFIWARIPNEMDDAIVFTDQILEKARVFITPGSIFGKNGSKYVRISLCSNMSILQEALERCHEMMIEA